MTLRLNFYFLFLLLFFFIKEELSRTDESVVTSILISQYKRTRFLVLSDLIHLFNAISHYFSLYPASISPEMEAEGVCQTAYISGRPLVRFRLTCTLSNRSIQQGYFERFY